MAIRDAVMSPDDLTQFLRDVFPQVCDTFVVNKVTSEGVIVRLLVGEQHLRPGGTISGPSMFGLADVAVYLAVLSRIGPRALAVTTNCSIDFMRKPVAGLDLIAECRLLKLGKVLAVGDTLIRSAGLQDPVCRATLTYSIPPS